MTDDQRTIKLVRDLIPEQVPKARVDYRFVKRDEAEKLLQRKLIEEWMEYLEEPSLSELADIYEVICALGYLRGWAPGEIHHEALKKRTAKGGFRDGVALVLVREESE